MTGTPAGAPPAGYRAVYPGAGTLLGVVNTHLPSIEDHVAVWTDAQLKRLVDAIKTTGHINACLFVLVADHGLIAYQNTDAFNITSEDGNGVEIQALFNTPLAAGGLGRPLWRGVASGLTGAAGAQSVFSPNGGMGQIYLREPALTFQAPPVNATVLAAASLLHREATGYAGQLYTELAPAPPPPALTPAPPAPPGLTNGALGNPPAIFVKVAAGPGAVPGGNFIQNFQWVSGVGPAPAFTPTLAPITAFIAARTAINPAFNWPAFVARMDESNHKRTAGSRRGDIVFATDTEFGYLTVNRDDGFNGWHGGATEAESYVPLMFSMPGPALVPPTNAAGAPLPNPNPAFIQKSFNTFVTAPLPANGFLRSYQLSDILSSIVGSVRNTTDPAR